MGILPASRLTRGSKPQDAGQLRRKGEVKDTLLLTGLGGSEKLGNTGLGFLEEVPELTFRVPVLYNRTCFAVSAHQPRACHSVSSWDL